MVSEDQHLGSRQVISRFILVCIWLSLPISIIFNLPEKVVVSVIIFTGFIFFSHSCLAYIHNDLIVDDNKWLGLVLILLFGPVEADRLKKINKQKLVNNTP